MSNKIIIQFKDKPSKLVLPLKELASFVNYLAYTIDDKYFKLILERKADPLYYLYYNSPIYKQDEHILNMLEKKHKKIKK